jgi:transposase InsO family protein
VVIQRVLTDNAKTYTDSVVFAETAAGLGIRCKRTRPYRPQTNGKVERFNRTLLESGPMGGCIGPVPSAARPSPGGYGPTITGDHTALDGLTPMAVLVNNLGGNHTTMVLKAAGRYSGFFRTVSSRGTLRRAGVAARR